MKDALLSIIVGVMVAAPLAWFLLGRESECEKRGGVVVHGSCIKKECILK